MSVTLVTAASLLLAAAASGVAQSPAPSDSHAIALFDAGEYATARAELDATIRRNSKALSPLYGHLGSGFLAQREKNNALAEREYEAGIAAAPDSAAGYLSLGMLYQREQRWTDAFATYDRLLKRRPDEIVAQFHIGRTAALSGQGLERGEQSIKIWLAKPPKDARTASVAGAHHRLGQIHHKKGRVDAARAEYEEALRIDPKNEDARASLASLP